MPSLYLWRITPCPLFNSGISLTSKINNDLNYRGKSVGVSGSLSGPLGGLSNQTVWLIIDSKIEDGDVTDETGLYSLNYDLYSNENKACIIGLVADPERLADIRRNRVAIMRDNNIKEYTELSFIKSEVDRSKKLFNKYKWPIIDVTRRSVEETAASILKIFEIQKSK